MVAGDEVAVPTQHGLGAYQQPDPAQHVAGEVGARRRQEDPIGGFEADLPTA